MLSCNHTSWLSFHKQEQIALRQTNALYEIVTKLDAPAQKYPSLVVLAGNLGDYGRLCDLIPRTRRQPDTESREGIQLQLDHRTAFTEHPLLVAHGCVETFGRTLSESAIAPCHTHAIRELRWPGASSEPTASVLFSRLLQPFAHLVCFFVRNGESTRHIASRLRGWCKEARPGQQPRLLVVAAPEEKRSAFEMQIELTELFQERLEPSALNLFAYISVYSGNDQRTLQDRIHNELSYSRENRMRHNALLSAVHLESLFSRACDHIVASGSEPFDMLAASRWHRPVSSSLGEHVADLLASVDSYEELNQFAIPFIAECLRLDSSTKDVHGCTSVVIECEYC
jgi:hypothetical protein